MVWAEMKKYIESHNRTNELSINNIEKLIHESFINLDNNLWNSCIEHTHKVEEDFWRNDILIDNIIDDLIIDINSDSDTESDSCDSSDSDLENDHNYHKSSSLYRVKPPKDLTDNFDFDLI